MRPQEGPASQWREEGVTAGVVKEKYLEGGEVLMALNGNRQREKEEKGKAKNRRQRKCLFYKCVLNRRRNRPAFKLHNIDLAPFAMPIFKACTDFTLTIERATTTTTTTAYHFSTLCYVEDDTRFIFSSSCTNLCTFNLLKRVSRTKQTSTPI